MRVTDIDLITNDTNILSFGLAKVSTKDRFLSKALIGMDADEIIPKFYHFSASGRKYYDFSMNPREIVLRVVLNPNYVLNERHADVRDELYRAISSSRTGEVRLVLKAGASSVAQINGFITKFEVPLNSKIPELQMTIICDDPILRGVTPVEMHVGDWMDDENLQVVDALSTSPHGVSMEWTLTGDYHEFVMQDKETDPEWEFKVTYDFLIGDKLFISSNYSGKKCYVDRGGTITHLMNVIEPNSVWPTIFPGANDFYHPYHAVFFLDLVEYYPAYWGI